MRYEKKTEPLATKKTYYRRIARNLVWVAITLTVMLVIGTVGYRYATRPCTGWLDAFHNSAMIVGGMGPVITGGFTTGGKIFSSFYALFSGVVFIGMMGLILAPGMHRLFHRLHIQEK